jgi:hypothetical protein
MWQRCCCSSGSSEAAVWAAAAEWLLGSGWAAEVAWHALAAAGQVVRERRNGQLARCKDNTKHQQVNVSAKQGNGASTGKMKCGGQTAECCCAVQAASQLHN